MKGKKEKQNKEKKPLLGGYLYIQINKLIVLWFYCELLIYLYVKYTYICNVKTTKMATAVSSDRIDFRINTNQKELIKYASELKGFKSLSEFIIYCANTEANKIISEHSIVLKTYEDQLLFVNTMLNPPEPSERLKMAQSNYLKFIDKNEPKDRATKPTTRKK
jgi:uncharacterized protein (DUF1778 family)